MQVRYNGSTLDAETIRKFSKDGESTRVGMTFLKNDHNVGVKVISKPALQGSNREHVITGGKPSMARRKD